MPLYAIDGNSPEDMALLSGYALQWTSVIAAPGFLGVVDVVPSPTTDALTAPIGGTIAVMSAYGGLAALPGTNAIVNINGTPVGPPSALPPAGLPGIVPQGVPVAAGDYIQIAVDAPWDGSVVLYIVPVAT